MIILIERQFTQNERLGELGYTNYRLVLSTKVENDAAGSSQSPADDTLVASFTTIVGLTRQMLESVS